MLIDTEVLIWHVRGNENALACSFAIYNGFTLVTGNDKHYKLIKEVD